MGLYVYINFKNPRQSNYFLEHPYSYNNLTEYDKANFQEEECWSANITHNLGEMASHIPVGNTTLYMACWRPEEIGIKTAGELLPLLIEGLHYTIDHRKELERFNPDNGWGDYNRFIKFLLNYKQACEDNDPECEIEVSR